ncbi:MAG TPA: ABC transporter permease [Nocardioidaceae bacterium]|nr:ABC transporter permease [Nocardioidaceae bacterium]
MAVTNPAPPTGRRPDSPSRLELVLRQVEYWKTVYLRTWKGSAVSSFVTPLLYVAAMGLLLGGFIDSGDAQLEGAPTYLAYIAPGLLAAHVMQTAVGEVLWPVMGMIKWNKTYIGMIATPLGIKDIVAAHFGFVLFRVGTTAAVFMVVLAFFGVYTSLSGALAAFAVQLLIGLAFGTLLYAYSAGLKSEAGFALVYRLGVVPLFLFSGAFFPISNLSAPLEWLARVTPLWHGVDLTRMLTLGNVDVGLALVHVVYLLAMVAVGWWLAVRRLHRRLVV